MKPDFSFKYNGKKYDYSSFKNNKGVLDDALTVTLLTNDYSEYDAVEWVMYFENTGQRNSGIISEIYDCDISYSIGETPLKKTGFRPEPGNIFVKRMNGMVDGHHYWENDMVSATEYQFEAIYLPDHVTRKFQNTRGRSSEGTMPFFTLEYKNKGFVLAVGWTGSWKTEFKREQDTVFVKSGLQKARFYLEPHEKIRTTSTLVMAYSEQDDSVNKFRRLIKNHFSHKACTAANRDGLMALEFWGGLPSGEMKKRLEELKNHGVKFEDLWLDAGWYGQCEKCDDPFSGDWSQNTGDWHVNQRVHPHELIDVKSAARENNMNMMLWLEPERVTSKTRGYKEHPAWFLSIPDSDSHILYYGHDEAFDYIFNTVDAYIEKLGMSCFRQDFNTDLKAFLDKNEEENREGILEVKHIEGMYKLWDKLLEKHPGLIIDNCSGGGRRIDIETLKRSIPFFRSDYQCNFNENPDVLQTHNTGISNYLPYNGCTSKTKSDTYAIRSSYSSSWGGAYYNGITQSMSEDDFAWAKQTSDEYLKIRHYFTMDFYNHGSSVYDDTAWAIWQYH
ncbi:MAG: hypothetical protein GX173_05380, partial [Ruminococcaceae bacterium]|nr:hypothetical protein [Oscillospiraceae bacterium]